MRNMVHWRKRGGLDSFGSLYRLPTASVPARGTWDRTAWSPSSHRIYLLVRGDKHTPPGRNNAGRDMIRECGVGGEGRLFSYKMLTISFSRGATWAEIWRRGEERCEQQGQPFQLQEGWSSVWGSGLSPFTFHLFWENALQSGREQIETSCISILVLPHPCYVTLSKSLNLSLQLNVSKYMEKCLEHIVHG